MDEQLEAVLIDAQKVANKENFPVSVWHYEHLRAYSTRFYLDKPGRFICSVAPQAKHDPNATRREAAQAEVERLTKWQERCEELEVVAAALYLGHDDGKEQFDMYRSAYITTADDDNIFLAAIATDKENENEN